MRDLPSRYVEIGNFLSYINTQNSKIFIDLKLLSWSLAVSAFETEFFISGLAPLADQLVTLYFVKENSEQMVGFLILCTLYDK